MIMIETKDLTFAYPAEEGKRSEPALRGVSLGIEKGSFVVVLGHNGSGKSTLAKHLNALLIPTEGTLWVDGIDTSKEPELWKIRQKAGMVFQNPDNQIIGTVVEEDVGFGPENMGVPTEKIWERVDESLKKTGMTSYRYHSPNKLSGGQKQRVAIAGVMAMRPKVLILDEPTAGLDPRGREMILGQIKHYHEETGSTVLLVSHSMEDVARFAQKILVMNKGEVFCYDTPPAVFARADEIAAIGLSVPQITKVFSMLRSRGIDIRGDVYTIEFAMKTINEYLAAKGKAGEGNA